MKSAHMKPLVTISTYEERQEELSKTSMMKDEVDHRSTNGQNNLKTETNNNNSTSNGFFPTPPPPPEFANKSPSGIINKYSTNSLKRTPSQVKNPPETPIPDYDSTPSHTLPKLNGSSYNNGVTKSTIGRVAATERARANGDVAELASIDSYKLRNPSSPIPRPPSLYFAPQNSGPPTMKKTNRPVSVTIGEYGVGYSNRKEPTKFDFIARQNENGNGNGNRDDNVSEMLRSELEKTLSRSNLKKRNENEQIGKFQNGVTAQNGFKQNGVAQNGKPILQKTQSTNIERLANMIQGKQNTIETNTNSNRSATLTSANRVTINIPNKIELRKTESTPPAQTNGILKNGLPKANFSEKSISFGN